MLNIAFNFTADEVVPKEKSKNVINCSVPEKLNDFIKFDSMVRFIFFINYYYLNLVHPWKPCIYSCLHILF